MKGKILSIIGIFALVLVSFASAMPAQASPPDDGPSPLDVGAKLREWEAVPELVSGEVTPELVAAAEEAAAEAAVESDLNECTLDEKYFLYLDDYEGLYDFTLFLLVAEDDTAQIWVQADLSWPEGDPRDTPVVTCDQAAYMLGEFSGNMYPTETSFFGAPDFHDGGASLLEAWGNVPEGYYDDEAGRQIVLVENVRDEQYYDPTYPLYIAGFFSPSLEAYFDRNTMTIDSYQWEERTGPDGSRPYLYEGTFAHEYQHLLHSDYDGDEENFVNEGLSDLAQYLTGYGLPGSHVDAAASNPENSLVLWGDQGDLEILTDYGNAFLFQFYLMEQYGPEFIQAEFHEPENGISGINATLGAAGSHRDFADVYHDFAVAEVIDAKYHGRDQYKFQEIDFTIDAGTPDEPNPEAFDTAGAPPWGTDFVWLTGDPKDLSWFVFNGVDYSMFATPWTSDGDVLFSGDGDLIDNWAIFEATAGSTLTFDTYYDIEDYWDFGFVQVSTDGGQTWASLANEYTTTSHDPDAISTVVENLPGLTSFLTDWVTMSFDTSAYAGQDVLFAFRYVTDWGTTYAGWFVDNVYVDDVLVSDGSDASIFKDITEIVPIENDFNVTFVGFKDKRRGKVDYTVANMRLRDVTEDGIVPLRALMKNSDRVLMLVTFDASEGFTHYAEYSYEFVFKHHGPFKHNHRWRRGPRFHNGYPGRFGGWRWWR
jgi:immune inhibitor A